jgi:xanthine/CO dehydrogenase XdhC/CoxF family maturation factor
VQAGEWANLAPEAGSTVLIAGDHEDHGTVLRRVLAAQPGYVAMVASRKVAQGLLSALRRQGLPEAEVAAVRTPAGLDLCARTLEEISISVLSELLAWERNRDGRPLRRTAVADAQPEPRAAATDPPPPLVIVGHGRIAEELARLATLTGWPVTVNAVNAAAADFPPGACLITDDLDYARLDITPASFVVVAILHKGDHLSMQKALAGDAAYIGLIASRKRAGLILDFLREKNAPPDRMRRVFAPAGLNVGALNPTEIAFSILCEMVAVHRRGTALPLVELERLPSSGVADACRQLFQ